MQKRILFLTSAVPPLVSGSAIIARNLAKQFSRQEMIVAGEQPYEGPCFAWRHDWPPIFYLIKGWPPYRRGRRWWRKLVFPLLLVRCIRLAQLHKCDTLLVVFPNEQFLLAGYLTARWTGATLFPYFHNTYAENRRGLSRLLAQWLQSRVFAKAEHVFVMSEGMVELYSNSYPGLKCSALVHCLSDDIRDAVPLPPPQSPFRLVICGSINESCREATVRIFDAASQMGDTSLTFLSGTDPADLKGLGLLRNGTQYAKVSPDEVITRLSEGDVVILPHGFSGAQSEEEYRTCFPTRTVEYLISGRPILAHAPPDCYLTRFLRKHRCALIVDKPDTSALIDAVNTLRTNPELRVDLVRNALRAAEMFRGPRVAAKLRALIEGDEIIPVFTNEHRIV